MYTNSITTQQTTTVSHYYEDVNVLPVYPTVSQEHKCSTVHTALIQYVEKGTGERLTDSERELIVDNVKFKKLKRRQYFLFEGDVCRTIGFIVKGSTRMFSINERGQESIISFGLENCWIADHESFKTSKISNFNIEALEDTELLLMTASQMDYLVKKIPALNRMFGQYNVDQLIDTQRRINAALSMTAQERYMDLINSRPEYSQRFSQNMLACYLGVKPETLSRIRRR